MLTDAILADPQPGYGALRSRTVARLAGVTLRQLGYWHGTDLIQAHTIPGTRGVPRLYSWIDYMKIRAAKKLKRNGMSTPRIRAAVTYMDKHIPDWYRYPVHEFGGRVRLEKHPELFTADADRQLALPLMLDILYELVDEGPLGELRTFDDAIDMNPDVVSGNPVIRGTRLETAFIANLAHHGVHPKQIAALYSLTVEQVKRTLAFSEAAA